MPAKSGGALAGIRVVELGQLIAGPFCGQLLGDMGADVVKVEAPGEGDPMRRWGQGSTKLWWEIIARNKRSVTANLRVPEGQAIVRALAVQADILIENFKPGTMERWNLSPSDLQAINPRLIVVRVSGYGQTGPYSARAGFGGVAEAMGGWRYIVGEPDGPPSRMGIAIGDTLAATYACMGALAALQARHRTGCGQVVDMALYEAVLQVMESLIPEYTVNRQTRERSGSILPGIAPSNVYRCTDGELLIGANKDQLFVRLATAMEQPGLANDPRFATHDARGENQTLLDEIILAWTSRRTVAEVERLMLAADIPSGRIFRAPDMMDDPHFAARQAIVEVESASGGMIHMQNCFPRLSDTPSAIRAPAPLRPGQDNGAVYADWLGWSETDLAAHQAEGSV